MSLNRIVFLLKEFHTKVAVFYFLQSYNKQGGYTVC